MQIIEVAQLCHQLNKAYCEQLGDNSQPDWDDAPNWQKESAINGVKFHLENPDAKAAASHNSWLLEKEQAGWKYGEVKDAEAKTHPCFVPFSELPEEQQIKDYLFKGIIESVRQFIV